MANNTIYQVAHRRRREQKTNYKLRLSLLKSGTPRLVVRKSNRYVSGQIISYSTTGDTVRAQANSTELRAMGWKHSCANTTAAYLTGMLLGKRAKDAGIEEGIVDIGLQRNTKGNVLYALVKGAIDSGLRIPHGEDVIPNEERLTGKYLGIEKDYEQIKSKIG